MAAGVTTVHRGHRLDQLSVPLISSAASATIVGCLQSLEVILRYQYHAALFLASQHNQTISNAVSMEWACTSLEIDLEPGFG